MHSSFHCVGLYNLMIYVYICIYIFNFNFLCTYHLLDLFLCWGVVKHSFVITMCPRFVSCFGCCCSGVVVFVVVCVFVVWLFLLFEVPNLSMLQVN